MPYTFLSDEWLAEVRKLQEGVDVPTPAALADLKLNIVVTGGPEGDKDFHFAGGMNFEPGLVDDAPTKLTVPYDVAKAMFVEGNNQAAMQAFMQGQIKVEGDMSRLMAMQGAAGAAPSAEQTALTAKIREITA